MTEKKQYKVLVSPVFNSMLEQHVAFLASQDIAAARRLYKKMIQAVKALNTFPERYPVFEQHNLSFHFRKMFVPNWYLVIYEISNDTVKIQYMIDCRQENSWLLDGQAK